jgi:hypothetical protein
MRGGYLDDHRIFYDSDDFETASAVGGAYTYVQPYFILAEDIAGFSAGVIRTTRPLLDDKQDPTLVSGGARYYPSFAVRVGEARPLYGTFDYLNGFPLYSDGGYMTAGLGATVFEGSVWFGASLGKGLYEHGGLFVRVALPAGRHLTLDLNARAGKEYGFGGALGYRFYHGR